MSDLLCRAKEIDTGEWVEGYYVPSTDPDLPSVLFTDIGSLLPECFRFHSIDDNTVGRCTGMLDKAGKRIFEGDLVQAELVAGPYQGYAWPVKKVKFMSGSFCLVDDLDRIFSAIGAFAPNVSFEIVGNIYDGEVGKNDEV